MGAGVVCGAGAGVVWGTAWVSETAEKMKEFEFSMPSADFVVAKQFPYFLRPDAKLRIMYIIAYFKRHEVPKTPYTKATRKKLLHNQTILGIITLQSL